jgi:hypothetical protein
MRKTEAECKLLKMNERLHIDILGHPLDNPCVVTMDTQERIKPKREGGYPLRFKSKAQKERIEKAAKIQRKSLREFILDCLEAEARNHLKTA